MEQLSSLLFTVGVMATAIGFAAHVGHAVLLANGRRAIVLAPTGPRPAFASGGVTGSFVTSRAARADAPVSLSASPTPLSRAATWITVFAFASLVASLAVRGLVVGRGPYGNLYEFSAAFAAGLGYLAQGTQDRFSWLPPHRTLDEVAYRSVIIGFPIFATMIVLGSWWASIAWSRYWGWDPKETAALVTWLVYAVYLHARNQKRWAGRPAALLLVVGFAMVIVTYSGSLWFSGLHAYSGL